MENKTILSISMLISNKEETVLKSLRSLEPIREAISCELILVDTGASQKLKAEINAIGDVVTKFEWCDDFAKARNHGLSLANGEWFMYLDDDEIISEPSALVEFFVSQEYKKYGYASYIVRNYLDTLGERFSDCWVERLAQRSENLHFEGKIHEYLAGKTGVGKKIKTIAEHYGYVFSSNEARMKHFRRNELLLREMINENPNDIRLGVQLLQEYRTAELYGEMVECGQRYISLLKERNDQISAKLRGCIGLGIIIGYAGKEDYYNAYGFAKCMLDKKGISLLAKLGVYQILLSVCFELAKYDEALVCGQRYFEIFSYLSLHEDERFEMEGLPFVGEAMDEIKQEEVSAICICADLKRGLTKELNERITELKWEKANVYMFEHFAETVIEAMSCIEPQKDLYVLAKKIWLKPSVKNHFISTMNERFIEDDIKGAIDMFKKVDEAIKIWEDLQNLKKVGMQEQYNFVLKRVKELLVWDDDIQNM